jgi:hypothetical protein
MSETNPEPQGDPEVTGSEEVAETGDDEGLEGTAETDSDAGEGEPAEHEPQDKGKKDEPQGETDLDRVRKALTAERASRKKLEKDMAALRRSHASAEERAILEAKEGAAAEREAEIRPPLLKALAAAELRAAGIQGAGAQRLVGLLDMDKVDVDDEGNLVGLDDQIAGLKEEFPNLFAAPDNGRRTPPAANAGSGSRSGRKQDAGEPAKPKPWYEQLADQVLNAQAPPGVGRR